jgi:hypothetical protein
VLAIKKKQISFLQKLCTCTVRKGYSAGNYQLLDEESTVRKEFRWNHQILNVEIHRMNGILLGITGFWTRNPPEEWNSAGKTGSWTWIHTGKIKNLPISNNSRNTLKDLFTRKANFLEI